VTAAMSTRDLESDAIVLLRLARVYLGRDVTSVHIDATGLAITVATEDAAHRLVDSHGLRRVSHAPAAHMWAGVVGDATVSVHIDPATAPARHVRGAA
jgi:hypothetical protein